MNQVGLVGYITKDPSLRTVSGNRQCTNFVIAVNRNFRNSQGVVDADFIPCIAWGKLAERIVKYCGKGSLLGIKGKLQSNTFTTKENKRVYTIDVLVDDVRFYTLKQPIHSSSQTSKGEEENLKHFVLPKEEELLPVP